MVITGGHATLPWRRYSTLHSGDVIVGWAIFTVPCVCTGTVGISPSTLVTIGLVSTVRLLPSRRVQEGRGCLTDQAMASILVAVRAVPVVLKDLISEVGCVLPLRKVVHPVLLLAEIVGHKERIVPLFVRMTFPIVLPLVLMEDRRMRAGVRCAEDGCEKYSNLC